MRTRIKACLGVAVLVLLTAGIFLLYPSGEEKSQPEIADTTPPRKEAAAAAETASKPRTAEDRQASEKIGVKKAQTPVEKPQQAEGIEQEAGKAPEELEEIDPQRLGEAEIRNIYNEMYETEARARLPLLSVQAHNPVWALRHEAEQKAQKKLLKAFLRAFTQGESGSGTEAEKETTLESETAKTQGPLPAPEYGEFSNLQPPKGEVWVRIKPEFADQSRDIMAQNADLFRKNTAHQGPVTVTLWVGGQPYDRQVYE